MVKDKDEDVKIDGKVDVFETDVVKVGAVNVVIVTDDIALIEEAEVDIVKVSKTDCELIVTMFVVNVDAGAADGVSEFVVAVSDNVDVIDGDVIEVVSERSKLIEVVMAEVSKIDALVEAVTEAVELVEVNVAEVFPNRDDIVEISRDVIVSDVDDVVKVV